jgi:hypothetical protein
MHSFVFSAFLVIWEWQPTDYNLQQQRQQVSHFQTTLSLHLLRECLTCYVFLQFLVISTCKKFCDVTCYSVFFTMVYLPLTSIQNHLTMIMHISAVCITAFLPSSDFFGIVPLKVCIIACWSNQVCLTEASIVLPVACCMMCLLRPCCCFPSMLRHLVDGLFRTVFTWAGRSYHVEWTHQCCTISDSRPHPPDL